MSKTSKVIVLSAGGDDNELAEAGLGMEHVDELLVRMSRRLLQAGHRLAYGGTLGVPKADLTKLLINAAVGWLNEGTAEEAEVTEPDAWPLVNYSAWPYYTYIEAGFKANLVGVCRFTEVPPPKVSAAELAELVGKKDDPDHKRLNANALSEMRRISTENADLRIVWGGKIRGAAGWMSGIAEEVLCSLEQEKPMLILGGFGGCAGLLASFLSGPKRDKEDLDTKEDPLWPAALTFEDACRNASYKSMLSACEAPDSKAKRFTELQDRMTALKDRLDEAKDVNGVPTDLFNAGLGEDTARRAMRLAQQVAEAI